MEGLLRQFRATTPPPPMPRKVRSHLRQLPVRPRRRRPLRAAQSNNVTPLPGSGGLAPVNQGVTHAAVTKSARALPQDAGQVWREYDIRPYTLRVTTTARPEQAIVDWILRETGYEAWHSDPVGLLSANREVLRVYHTPEMQAVVADIVDRFVNIPAECVRVHAARGDGRQSQLAGQGPAA